MLLNFSLPDILPAKESFKGGRWKVRLSAKRAADRRLHKGETGEWEKKSRAQRWETKTPRYPSGDQSSAEDDVDNEHRRTRPSKRPRTGAVEFTPATSDYGAKSPRTGRKNASNKPKQIISSLFSFNPESMSKSDTALAETEAAVEPSNAPLPSELNNFTSLGLSATLAAHLLNKMELKAPTAIQKAALTQLLRDDSDAFIQAETGSGKTLAYLLPLVQRLMTLSKNLKEHGNEAVHRDSGLFAIILAPTRELSKQISVVLERLLGCANWLVAGTVLGGEKKKSEKARLRKGLNILVATPGRLADHLDHTEVLDVSNVRWLVLDEGDRLMELGFEEEIQRIVAKLNLRMTKTNKNIKALPARRTTILCSATMKMDVQRLGEISLKDAVHISAEAKDGPTDEEPENEKSFSAPAQLKQSYAVVPAKLRLVTLLGLLKRTFARRGSVMKAIVFISCADSVDFHFEIFARQINSNNAESGAVEDGPVASEDKNQSASTESRTHTLSPALSSKNNNVYAYKLHGSLPQPVRTSTLAAYAKCKDPAILICTDVASRGLDLPDVDFVIEYDPAFSKEDHLHRIGRTARAGRDGRALIFLQPGPEEGYIEILEGSRRDAGKGLARHEADEILKRGFTAAGLVSSAPSWEEQATEFQLEIERWALASPRHLERARRAYQSHVRAYATHIAAERHFFNIKDLHLGHLAKAFALRDKPGSINVAGLRGGKDSGKRSTAANGKRSNTQSTSKTKEVRRTKGIKGDGEFDSIAVQNEEEARRRMRSKMKEVMGGVSEFNLG